MIETHVVNALLRVDLKDQSLFKIITFANGLVAPSFLFCAGFAFALTIHRKWNDYITLRPVLWRYIVRLFFILIVGYSLHLPFFSLTRLISLTDERLWVPFFQVDILQTISVTLLSLVLFAIIVRRENRFIWMTFIVSMLLIFSAPVVREMDLSSLPIWVRSYLTPQFKSQFPLFPWSAFLITGTIIGYWFLDSRERGEDRKFINMLAALALAAVILSLVFEYLPMTIYSNHDFWKASPEFFFVRLGLVMMFLVGLWFFELKRKVSTHSVFIVFGHESLLVYTVHLLVVYGYTYEWSFVRYFGQTLNYFGCFGLFISLTIVMYVMAYVWHLLKGWNKRVAKMIEFAVLAGIVLMFLLKQN